MDTYVSLKKRKHKDYLFGFVRFRCEDEARNAMDRKQGLEIRGRKLRISWANNSNIHQQVGMYPRLNSNILGKSRGTVVTVNRNCRESEEGRRVINVEEEVEFKEWLANTFICKPFNERNLTEILERISNEGIENLAVSKFDSDRFIVNQRDEGSQLKINDSDMAKMKNIFSEITPWTSDLKQRWHKQVEVVGLPLHIWKHNNLRKICDKWGKLIEVTSMEDYLESCALLIETDSVERIDEVLNLKHGHNLYLVSVRELCPYLFKQKYEKAESWVEPEIPEGWNNIDTNHNLNVEGQCPSQNTQNIVKDRRDEHNLENRVTNLILETMVIDQSHGGRGEEAECSNQLPRNLVDIHYTSTNGQRNNEAAICSHTEEVEESHFQIDPISRHGSPEDCHVSGGVIKAKFTPQPDLSFHKLKRNKASTVQCLDDINLELSLARRPNQRDGTQDKQKSLVVDSSPPSTEILTGLDKIDPKFVESEAVLNEKDKRTEAPTPVEQISNKRGRGRPRKNHGDQANEAITASEIRRSSRSQKGKGPEFNKEHQICNIINKQSRFDSHFLNKDSKRDESAEANEAWRIGKWLQPKASTKNTTLHNIRRSKRLQCGIGRPNVNEGNARKASGLASSSSTVSTPSQDSSKKGVSKKMIRKQQPKEFFDFKNRSVVKPINGGSSEIMINNTGLEEAKRTWEIGKLLGLRSNSKDEDVIESLRRMQQNR